MDQNQYRKIQVLLYLLMRDHMPTGRLSELITSLEAIENKRPVFTAKGLASYAEVLTDRLLKVPAPEESNSRDVGRGRIDCTLCGKAIEGGHERDSHDWCECVRCAHCDVRMRRREPEEQHSIIDTLCERCLSKGVELDGNGDPFMRDRPAPPVTAKTVGDSVVMEAPSDTENRHLLDRLTGRGWTTMMGLYGTNQRGFSTVLAAPSLALVVHQSDVQAPWTVCVLSGGWQEGQKHMLVGVNDECMTLEAAMQKAHLFPKAPTESVSALGPKRQARDARTGPYDGTSEHGLRRRLLFLASHESGEVAAYPGDAGEIRRALSTTKAEQVREVWPEHGQGPEWRMHNPVRPADHGVMVLDLAFKGEVCSVRRLMQLGVWPHGEKWGE